MGPNEGMATVWTVTTPTYAEQCPNVHKLLTNLTFTAADESRMMQPLLEHKDAFGVRQAVAQGSPPRTSSAGWKV